MCQRSCLMYWLGRDACGGLLSGHTLIALPADLLCARCALAWFGMVWFGLVWSGLVWCDGSSVEISITQANDK